MKLFKIKIESVNFTESKYDKNLSITNPFNGNDIITIVNNSLAKEEMSCEVKSLRYINVDNALYVEGIAFKINDIANSKPDFLFI